MTAIGHEAIFGIALLLEWFPAVVVENYVTTAHDAVEQMLKYGDLGGRRIEIDVQECDTFRDRNPECIRYEAANDLDVRHIGEFLDDRCVNCGIAVNFAGHRQKARIVWIVRSAR